MSAKDEGRRAIEAMVKRETTAWDRQDAALLLGPLSPGPGLALAAQCSRPRARELGHARWAVSIAIDGSDEH